MPDIIFDPQMTTGDMNALECFVSGNRPRVAAEIGSWKGLSTWILSKYCGILYCVDTWQATDSTPHMKEEAIVRDIFSIFKQNLTQFQLFNKVKPMMMASKEANAIFKDEYLDFVFIDCDHVYESVKWDIIEWSKKVKKGGVICGHDCEILWKDCDSNMKIGIDQNLNVDFIKDALGPGRGIHPGVTRAIKDVFNDDVVVLEGSSIWMKIK